VSELWASGIASICDLENVRLPFWCLGGQLEGLLSGIYQCSSNRLPQVVVEHVVGLRGRYLSFGEGTGMSVPMVWEPSLIE
jgi:hypothetical protein